MAQYFTDFSEYTPDQEPNDWDEFGAGGFGVVRDSSLPSGSGIQALDCADDTRMLWGAVGFPTGDVEVVVKVLLTEMGANPARVRITLHHADLSGNDYYYIDMSSLSGGRARIMKVASGSGSVLATATDQGYDENVWYLIRLNRSGSLIRGKVWEEGVSEPSDWLLSTTDTDHSSGGVGVLRTAGDTLWVDHFGVGTGGDPAPLEPLQPDPPTGLNAIATGPTSFLATWDEP